MKELTEIVAENLVFLRKKSNMTQLEFGEKFNYTDKTVSRWENGSILPSVDVLKQIADYYGVTVDYIISEHHSAKELALSNNKSASLKNKTLFVALIVTVIWAIAMVIYIAKGVLELGSINPNVNQYWKAFIWAVPVSFLIVAFYLLRWFNNRKWSYISLSGFVWTLLTAAYITFLYMGNFWFLYFIGIPIQIAIILLMNLKS